MYKPRTVLALDLSKTSTGYAIAQFDSNTGEGRVVRFGTVRPPTVASKARWLYPVVESVLRQIQAEIEHETWYQDREFSMAIEASIYGESFSEFQFYLTQDALRWASSLPVDVCTYAPGTHKAFVRRWSPRVLPKKLGKPEIEQVWRFDLRPLCPDAFPSSILSSNDAVDAGWLGLLGLYAQAHVLPTGVFRLGEETPAFVEDDDGLRRAFLKAKLNTLRNIAAPDLSGTYGNLRDNKHLSILGKGLYPFRQLDALAQYLREWRTRDPEAVFELAFRRKRPNDVSAKAIRTALESARFTCALDDGGRLLLSAAA